MKAIYSNLLVIIILTLISCTNSNIKISTEDNFEIIELPDGSTAYLNNYSSIKYKKNFDERIVKQNGEVFFEVKKGSTPFIVKTDAGEIQVLGTKFNVKSSNKELVVEVQEGVVELKINKLIKEIKKGQKAFFKRNQNSIKIGNAEFKHEKWLNSLDKELKELSKTIQKDSKKIRNDVKKEIKKFKKKYN